MIAKADKLQTSTAPARPPTLTRPRLSPTSDPYSSTRTRRPWASLGSAALELGGGPPSGRWAPALVPYRNVMRRGRHTAWGADPGAVLNALRPGRHTAWGADPGAVPQCPPPGRHTVWGADPGDVPPMCPSSFGAVRHCERARLQGVRAVRGHASGPAGRRGVGRGHGRGGPRSDVAEPLVSPSTDPQDRPPRSPSRARRNSSRPRSYDPVVRSHSTRGPDGPSTTRPAYL